MVSHLLFWGEAHEIIKRLRMFHAQPFDYFSCITFKESPLGAEHAFRIQSASFFNEIDSEMLSLTIKFSTNKLPTNSTRLLKTNNADEFAPFCVMKQKGSNSSACRRIRPPLRKKLAFIIEKVTVFKSRISRISTRRYVDGF